MGPVASEGWIQAGSSFAGINDTVAVKHVLYTGSYPNRHQRRVMDSS
jgi:hypothetical protein